MYNVQYVLFIMIYDLFLPEYHYKRFIFYIIKYVYIRIINIIPCKLYTYIIKIRQTAILCNYSVFTKENNR